MKRTGFTPNPAQVREWQQRTQQAARDREPKTRVSLAPVSPKRKTQNQIYVAERKAHLAENPNCARCATQGLVTPATEIHHLCGREGANLTDRDNFAGLCSDCHRWVHSNPLEARADGWLGTKHKQRDEI